MATRADPRVLTYHGDLSRVVQGDFFFAGVNNVKWRRPVVPLGAAPHQFQAPLSLLRLR